MSLCKITGQSPCRCQKLQGGKLSINFDDFKTALREAFSDHAWYTSWLITESLPVLQPNAEFVTQRLLENPNDIAALCLSLIGSKKAVAVAGVIRDHLLKAAACLAPVREGNTVATEKAVNELYAQGDKFGEALHSLGPNKLSAEAAKRMVREHNEFVVKLATLRKQQNYQEYIQTFDIYFNHMMMFSDEVANTLSI